jgi:hypothetical protein
MKTVNGIKIEKVNEVISCDHCGKITKKYGYKIGWNSYYCSMACVKKVMYLESR